VRELPTAATWSGLKPTFSPALYMASYERSDGLSPTYFDGERLMVLSNVGWLVCRNVPEFALNAFCNVTEIQSPALARRISGSLVFSLSTRV
jgi:hypothetical protein